MADKHTETRRDSSESKDQDERSGSESHGGLIFLLIVFGAIAFLVLYELLTGQ